jgi:hypothetical protein
MLSFLKKLFGFGSKPAAEAPYKVEAPSVVALGEPPATVVVPVAGLMLPVEGAGAVEVAPVADAPAAPAPAEKKPRAKKPAAEKKPRAPRAKKAPKA